jgi:hypothetical protein
MQGRLRYVFRSAHPHKDHFMPIDVAAGAGEGRVSVLSVLYGLQSVAF